MSGHFTAFLPSAIDLEGGRVAVINPALRVKLAVKFLAFAFWPPSEEREGLGEGAKRKRFFFVARSRACPANVFHYCGEKVASNMGRKRKSSPILTLANWRAAFMFCPPIPNPS